MSTARREHFIFLPQKSQLILSRNLDIIDLNESALWIVTKYLEGHSTQAMALLLSREFGIELENALHDISELVDFLQSSGVFPKKSSRLVPDWHVQTPIIHIIQNCNSPCRMCDCWKTKGKVHHPASALRPLFEQLGAMGAESVMISGGEPLLHPELYEILTDARRAGLKIMLNTNGTKLHMHPRLAEMGIEQLVVSMDGADAETYKRFRGIDAFDSIWRNITTFKASSPSTEIGIRTTLNRKNLKSLGDLIDRAKSSGVSGIGFSPSDVDSPSFSRDDMSAARSDELKALLLPSEEGIDEFLESFQEGGEYYEMIKRESLSGFLSWGPREFAKCLEFYRDVLRNRSRRFSKEPCLFPTVSMVLDYNGDLKSCFYSKPFGNLYALDKVEWSLSPRIEELHKSGKCETCRGRVFCDNATLK